MADISVDATDALAEFTNLEGELNRAGQRALIKAEGIIRNALPTIIMQIYENAVAEAGPGFYPIYAEHLRGGILRLEKSVSASEDSLEVFIGDIEELGDIDELMSAFNYQAILDISSWDEFVPPPHQPPLSEMGTPVEELWGNNHIDNRQDYWDAMQDGSVYESTWSNGLHFSFPTLGQLDSTLHTRVAEWGNRYPEWIILDEGWQGSEPTVNPTGFVSSIESTIEEYVDNILQRIALGEYKEVYNKPDRSVEPVAGFQNFKFRESTGVYTKAEFDIRIGAHGGFRSLKTGRFVHGPQRR